MYTGQMDVFSISLYIMLGIIAALCVFNEKNRYIIPDVTETKIHYRINHLLFLCCFFVFFATFRKIDTNLGGGDALVYLEDFDKMVSPNFQEYSHGFLVEYLFVLYMYTIRLITSCRKIFVFVSYSLIAFSYVIVIQKYIRENISAIPFLLLMFLYLKAFCTMRSSLAIALFMLGIVIIDQHKIISGFCILGAFFVHRMAVLFVPVYPFYFLMHKKIKSLTAVSYAMIAIFTMVIIYIVATIVQSLVISAGFLSSVDSWYMKAGMRQSFLSRWPMYFSQILLLICMTIADGKINKTELWHKTRTLFAYDLIIIPAGIILGFWRANEFLYVFRLIMWGYVIQAAEKWFEEPTKKIYKVVVGGVFIAWFLFRMYSEWDDLKIMPYLFDFTLR